MSNHRDLCPLGLSREILSAWRDRVLPDADAQRIAQHVAQCPACQGRLAQFARIAAAVQRQSVPDLRTQTWHGIQARLAGKAQHATRARRAVTFSGIGAVAVVALLVALFMLIFSLRPRGGGGLSPAALSGTATAAATPAPACPTFPAGYHTQLPDPGYTSTTVFAHIPLPPLSRIVANDAPGGQRGYDVCSAGTVASVTSFMSDHLPALGWTSDGKGIWTKNGYSLTVHVTSATDWNISWRDPDLPF